MKSLFSADALQEVVQRIEALRPDSQRLWGSMNPAQMLAHCSAALEVATGQKTPPRLFMGRVLAPFFRAAFSNETPFRKNSPTDKSFIVAGARDFEAEKERLKNLTKQFSEGGEAGCTRHPHSFFGVLSPDEWGKGMYKHLDHHLRQFGA